MWTEILKTAADVMKEYFLETNGSWGKYSAAKGISMNTRQLLLFVVDRIEEYYGMLTDPALVPSGCE